MNIVYFLGNGFDLNAGLNTKYSDFYDYLFSLKGVKANPAIEDLKNSISEYCEGKNKDIDWSDAELGFGQYTSIVKGKKNPDKIVADCHNYFCENLSIYLNKEEKRFPYSKLLKDDSLLTELWNGFIDVGRGLRPVDSNNIRKYIDKLPGEYHVSILDFNYTSIVDQLISQIEKKKLYGSRIFNNTEYRNHIDCLHVHGTTNHGLAFGVNDDTQYDKATFEGGIKEYSRQVVKPLFLRDMGEEIQEKAAKIIDSADIFYIYGMSIGKTDLYWWKLLINRMLVNSKAFLIIHDNNIPIIERSPTPYTINLREYREKIVSIIPKLPESLSNRIFTTPGNVFGCLEKIVDLA